MTKGQDDHKSVFDNVSPLDFRYRDIEIEEILSEASFIRYKLKVEVAMARVLQRRGLCGPEVVREIERGAALVSAADVDKEEWRTKHDLRALVNCLREQVSDKAKPIVHMTATSYDIVDTANALRYRDAANELIRRIEQKLIPVLAELAHTEAGTLQIGRTHGQHAVPITFGFTIASSVSRLGASVGMLKQLRDGLRGKFSGAVGAYNASSLFFSDPETFEADVLAQLNLLPAEHSTQIAPPEPLTRLVSEIVIAAGIMANLARDMRNLQRTEIGEVGEEFVATQVGSSTMPQKRNPIGFENVESIWKIVLGRMTTIYMDQVSEHQRDLTGSASGRTTVEIFAWAMVMTDRLTRVMTKLCVNHASLKRNLASQGSLVLSEPLQLLLASLGHPDAHEKVRQLTREAEHTGCPFEEIVAGDAELAPYLKRMTSEQREILRDPAKYTGIAREKTLKIVERWI